VERCLYLTTFAAAAAIDLSKLSDLKTIPKPEPVLSALELTLRHKSPDSGSVEEAIFVKRQTFMAAIQR
jgi:hypothetical protein